LNGWSSSVCISTTISSRKAPSGFFVVKIGFLNGLLGPTKPRLAADRNELWDIPKKSPSPFIDPAFDISSFLSLASPTIGEFACLFFDIQAALEFMVSIFLFFLFSVFNQDYFTKKLVNFGKQWHKVNI
jgi:hypothetical protein